MGCASYLEDIIARLEENRREAERAIVLDAGKTAATERLQELLAQIQPCLDKIHDLARSPSDQVRLADQCVALTQQVEALQRQLTEAQVTIAYFERETMPLAKARANAEARAEAADARERKAQRLYQQARSSLLRHEPGWEPPLG